jgi:hypothetical protein
MKNLQMSNGWMVGLILIFLSGLAISYFLPFPGVEKKINFALLDGKSSSEDLPVDLPNFLLDSQAELTLLLPEKIWLGEEASVNVKISLPFLKDKQNADLFKKYSFFYEARMNLYPVELLSGDTIYTPIRPGQAAMFNWQLKPARRGSINGNIWIYVHITDATTSQQWQIPRFALPLHIQVVDFLGFSLRRLRTLFILGLLLSIFLLMGFYLIGLLRRKSG